MKVSYHKYASRLVAILLVMVLGLTGCNISLDAYKNTKIVLTTGFDKDEVFRIDRRSCRIAEVMVYLTNTKIQYEQALGSQIWQTSYAGETLEENLR